jgi:methylmalonyl-CoA mutase, N-terminal domain
MREIDDVGGMVDAVESGHVQAMIASEAFEFEKRIAAGERPIVGVNCFVSDEPAASVEQYELNEDDRTRQVARLREVKSHRLDADVRASLAALHDAAASDDVNLMGPLVRCAQAYCTVGEIVVTLKEVWGEYRQPAGF